MHLPSSCNGSSLTRDIGSYRAFALQNIAVKRLADMRAQMRYERLPASGNARNASRGGSSSKNYYA